LSGIKPVIIS
jgi:hypothetical protein